MTVEIAIQFLARLSLVLLFLPFSALDKIVNFRLAQKQAGSVAGSAAVAAALILAGLFVEIVMSLGILTGIADRFCAFILAGYCAVTALLWKPFWRQSDFRLVGESQGREMFWDFLKNFAVAGGFLMLAFGTTAASVDTFLTSPFSSTHPYATAPGISLTTSTDATGARK